MYLFGVLIGFAGKLSVHTSLNSLPELTCLDVIRWTDILINKVMLIGAEMCLELTIAIKKMLDFK